ncbi:MAG: flagellar protein FliT [Pseudomonadota bacterium]
MSDRSEVVGIADAVAQLQWLTRERELSIAEGDWEAAQATEQRRWLVANEIFRNPQVLAEHPTLRSTLEEVVATDQRAIETVKQRQKAAGAELGSLRRGRQAADAYQQEAAG